jgi:large subunit ribosomal protein L22
MIEKVIRSAVANANEQSAAPTRNTLFVATAHVDPGPVIKRFQPKDRGKAYPIMKRTSHLVVTVDELAQDQKLKVKRVVGGRPSRTK